MKILFTSAEAVPFAKVGGLADVVGSLPAALRQLDIDARVILPGYGFINHLEYNITHLFSFNFTHRTGTSTVQVFTCVHQGVPYYFLQAWPYFGEEGTVYSEWNWDVPRYIYFCQLVMAATWELGERIDWFPDLLHTHDWHTSLIPFLIANNRWKQEWSQTATAITIHNIAYQGNNVGGFLWEAGIDARTQPDLVYQDLTDNLLGIGIAHSDVVTTVSPRYATEIQYPYAGYELASLIRTRTDDLYGILNGLDTDLWNPETDEKLIAQYSVEDFETKRILNKRHLQSFARLPLRDDVPIIGMVSRLASQKGFDMALPALRQLLVDTDAQLCSTRHR